MGKINNEIKDSEVSILIILEFVFRQLRSIRRVLAAGMFQSLLFWNLYLDPAGKIPPRPHPTWFQSLLFWNLYLDAVETFGFLQLGAVSILIILEFVFRLKPIRIMDLVLISFNPYYSGICI